LPVFTHRTWAPHSLHVPLPSGRSAMAHLRELLERPELVRNAPLPLVVRPGVLLHEDGHALALTLLGDCADPLHLAGAERGARLPAHHDPRKSTVQRVEPMPARELPRVAIGRALAAELGAALLVDLNEVAVVRFASRQVEIDGPQQRLQRYPEHGGLMLQELRNSLIRVLLILRRSAQPASLEHLMAQATDVLGALRENE